MYSSAEKNGFSYLNETKSNSFFSSILDDDKDTNCRSRILSSNALKTMGDLNTEVLKELKNVQILHLQYNDDIEKGLLVSSDCDKKKFKIVTFSGKEFKTIAEFKTLKKRPLAYFSLDGKYTVIVKTGKTTNFDFFESEKLKDYKSLCNIKIEREIKLEESMQWSIDSENFFVAQFPREKNRRVFVLNPKSCDKYRIADPRNVMRRASNYSDVDSKNNRIKLITFNDPPIIHQFVNDDYRYYKMEPIPAPPRPPVEEAEAQK